MKKRSAQRDPLMTPPPHNSEARPFYDLIFTDRFDDPVAVAAPEPAAPATPRRLPVRLRRRRYA